MDICEKCALPHEGTPGWHPCIDAQAEAMKKLLNLIGQPGVCRGCQVSVVWVVHNNGAKTPYDWSGLNHFVSCPKREQFGKKARA